MDAAPTHHEPGTPEKLAVMVDRYEHGVRLFVPGDRTFDHDPSAGSFLSIGTSNLIDDDEAQ